MNTPVPHQRFRLGTTLFSYMNEFWGRRYTLEELIARVAQLGLGPGLELVGFSHIRGFPAVTDRFAGEFRELVARHGLEPSCLSLNADVAIRRGSLMGDAEAAAYFEPQLRAAAKLGFRVAKTQLVAAPRVLEMLLPLAEELGILLGPELHAPWSLDSPAVPAYREMYERLKSPLLGFVPDFGSCARSLPPGYVAYLEGQGVPRALLDLAASTWKGPGDAQQRRAEFERRASVDAADPAMVSSLLVIFAMMSPQDPRAWMAIMPQIIHVHCKFYGVDAAGVEPAIAYEQLLPMLVEGGYAGYLASEWEGHLWSRGSGFDEASKFHAMARRMLAPYSGSSDKGDPCNAAQ